MGRRPLQGDRGEVRAGGPCLARSGDITGCPTERCGIRIDSGQRGIPAQLPAQCGVRALVPLMGTRLRRKAGVESLSAAPNALIINSSKTAQMPSAPTREWIF